MYITYQFQFVNLISKCIGNLCAVANILDHYRDTFFLKCSGLSVNIFVLRYSNTIVRLAEHNSSVN